MKTKSLTKAMIRKLLKIAVPQGFKAEFKYDEWRDCSQIFVMENEADGIRLTFRYWGGGTTEFKHENNWLSFDRRGVEDSFYWLPPFPGQKVDLAALVPTQLERVAKRREYYKTALMVPDIGFTLSPETYERYKKLLKPKNGSVNFWPSGFGTGYSVTRKPRRHLYSERRASPQLEAFFDASPLWVESHDCD